MAISEVSLSNKFVQKAVNNPNFKGEQSAVVNIDEEISDTYQSQYGLVPKTRKKIGMALVSMVPGAGFLANGQFGKAILTYLGIFGGAYGGGFLLPALLHNSTKPVLQKAALPAMIGGIALAAGTYIWSMVSSVRNSAKNIDIVELDK
jgi:hypothetical protein